MLWRKASSRQNGTTFDAITSNQASRVHPCRMIQRPVAFIKLLAKYKTKLKSHLWSNCIGFAKHGILSSLSLVGIPNWGNHGIHAWAAVNNILPLRFEPLSSILDSTTDGTLQALVSHSTLRSNFIFKFIRWWNEILHTIKLYFLCTTFILVSNPIQIAFTYLLICLVF